jgi:signal transduction histidine kinase
MQEANDNLEQRVRQRTAELAGMVEQLHREMDERVRTEQALRREQQTLQHLLESSDHERQLIAYEIHDGLAQGLAAAVMHLESAESLRGQDAETAARFQDTGLEMLRQSLNEARRLISDVRPPILDEQGIEAAIAHLVHEERSPDAPRIEFSCDVDFNRLDPILENAIYRITQESLMNACKHSKAERVRVELLQRNKKLVRVEIRDWGTGFDPANVRAGCFGLEGMRQRARLLGGVAQIESELGRGTTVIAELPLLLPRISLPD